MKTLLQILVSTVSYLKKYGEGPIIEAWVKKQWAHEVFSYLNFRLRVPQAPKIEGPAIFIANHISYMDIPLLMLALEDCSFLSKSEVRKWPLIGRAAEKINTVFVDRGSKDSRLQARSQIEKELIVNKKNIVVFPSGTTSIQGEKSWRKGIFEIAKNLNLPVYPIRIKYSQLRKVAYIDRDIFLFHLYRLSKQKSIVAEIVFHQPILIKNVPVDMDYCRSWCNDTELEDQVFGPPVIELAPIDDQQNSWSRNFHLGLVDSEKTF